MSVSDFWKSAENKMDCPIRIYPHCHPQAPLHCFASARNKTVTMACSYCERPIVVMSVIKDCGDKNEEKINETS